MVRSAFSVRDWIRRGREIVARISWARLGVLTAVVTLGFSQVFYNLILRNQRWFPRDFSLYGWVLVWVQILPLLVLLVGDLLCSRKGHKNVVFRAWRTLLYIFLAVSYLRQFQVYHRDFYAQNLSAVPAPVWYLLLIGCVALIGFQAYELSERYISMMGLVAVYFIATFVYQTGWQETPAGHPPLPESTADSHPRGAPPIFILVADGLSRAALLEGERIDQRAFPNFSRLAEESTWFRNTSANDAFTMNAIPIMLTGRRELRDESLTVFERLAPRYESILIETDMSVERWLRSGGRHKNGFRFRGKTRILGTSPWLAGQYLIENLLHSPFLRLARVRSLHDSPAIHVTFFAERDRFLKEIRTDNADGRLIYWHFSLPHAPFIYARDGSRHRRPERRFQAGVRGPFEEPRYDESIIMENYLEQVRLVDSTIGIFLEKVKAAGLYDRAVIIITSDHGLRQWHRRPKDHVALTAEVPLFIRAPGMPPGAVDIAVQHIDLVPTLLDLLGWHYSASEFEGVSALQSPFPSRARVFDYGDERFRFDTTESLWKVAESP